MLKAMDERTLGEARRVFAISKNVAGRLSRHNGMEIDTLYPPPKLGDRLRAGAFGDYVLTVGRLNPIKRFDLLLRAIKHARSGVRAVIAGSGPERQPLLDLARRLGVEDRVELLDWVDDETMVELYAGCLAVFYAPFDEDYGYVTVEALKAAKPVVTTADSGGVLEFVDDGLTGYVCAAGAGAPAEIAARFDRLYDDRDLACRLGLAGAPKAAGIDWDHVVSGLLG
jgi:glycosyltransferase involved in cell wall biosynthesis